jgi:tripartite-type tricarboxylate transporter receptor subunit TctC
MEESHMRFISAAVIALAIGAGLAAQCGVAATTAADAGYPTKPIRLIVPFSPGGTNDILGRMVATHMTDTLGKTMLVDNRTGAEGIIGTDLVAKATPDGYTLGVVSAAFVMNPAVRKLPYDPSRDFVFLSKLGASATLLCIGPALPVNSVKELLAAAKAKPGQITLGTSGGFQHFATALFRSLSAQDFNIIVYKGAFPAMVDVMGGQLHGILIPIAPALPHLRSGKLKALAVGTLKRSTLLPELATLDELGITGFDAANWYAIVAAAKTPPTIVNRLHTEIAKYMRAPETQKRLPGMGIEIDIKTDEEMRKIVPGEIAKWTKVAIAAKMPRDF